MQLLFTLLATLLPGQFTVEVVEPTPTPMVTPRISFVVEVVDARAGEQQSPTPATKPAVKPTTKPTVKPTIPSAGIIPQVNTNSRQQCVGGNCGPVYSGQYRYKKQRRGRR